MPNNLLLQTDSYKHSHFLQYPPNTQAVSSYVEARGGRFNEVVFFGLQKWKIDTLSKPITQEDIEEAAAILEPHGVPFNREGWEYIVNEHDGVLPIYIQSLPEGCVVPTSVPLVQIVNTDYKCAWLTSFLETSLLRAIWYPTTVATISRACKKKIVKGLKATSSHDDETIESIAEFMLHDFGARGVSSGESAGIGGLAHLINFKGSDTLEALVAAQKYYPFEDIPAFSVPASEHSTMTSWGRERECQAYDNMINNFMGQPIISIVSDSYDVFAAIDMYANELRETVEEARDNGSRLVVRPDSGNPIEMPISCIKRLMDRFGFTTNDKGFRILPDHIRVLQGDGINIDSIGSIITNLIDNGLAVENIVFGMGSGLLQQNNRDTLKFAMKASWAYTDQGDVPVYKKPVTDPGKTSKAGRFSVYSDGNAIHVAKADFLLSEDQLIGGARMLLTVDYPIDPLMTFEQVKENNKKYVYTDLVVDPELYM